MSWNGYPLSSSDWDAGIISISQVLYELERPTIFTTRIGLSTFIFFKKDELDETDIYLASPVNAEEIELLTSGKLSLRGALSHRICWVIETDLDLNVLRFQEGSASEVERLLPPKGLGLHASFGMVPDTTQEAQSFISFKFTGQSLSPKSMKLSVFKGLLDGVSNLVRHALLPSSLMRGRDSRFFDVEIGEPQFASLLISVKHASFDEEGLRSNTRTKNLLAKGLAQDTLDKGTTLWNSLESTSSLAMKGELTDEDASVHHNLLGRIIQIVPSEENDLDTLSVTFHGQSASGVVSIDKRTGDRLIRAQQLSEFSIGSLSGTVIEVNGDAKTFIIRTGDRSTTCAPNSDIFDLMDRNDLLKRGQKLKVHGKLWRRTRRDYLSISKYPEPVI